MSDSAEYLDLQVNGYAGVDFNSDTLTGEELRQACDRLVVDGVSGVLATIITDEIDVMSARLQHLARLRDADDIVAQTIWGLHIEGPFISSAPGYVGAHRPSAVRDANLDDMKRLLEAAGGLTRIVTLAPECDRQLAVTKFFASSGVIVSAGHCNPSLDQLQATIDAGLTMVTHLGNGCPGQLERHDNIIQRVLSLRDQLWISWIADGVHIPYSTLGNYLRCAGIERSVIVTDAISAAGLGAGIFSIGGRDVHVDEHLATRYADDASHLVGSAATMPMMARGLVESLGLSSEAIGQLTSINPRRILETSED